MARIDFYLDESGDFSEPGNHVICVVSSRDRLFTARAAEEWWKNSGTDWQSFHAVDTASSTLEKLLDEMAPRWTGAAMLTLIWHQNNMVYHYNFKVPLIIEAVAMAFTRGVEPSSSNQLLAINSDVVIETSDTFDLTILKDAIQKKIRTITRISGQSQATLNCRPNAVPKGIDPRVQIADLYGYAYRRHLNGDKRFSRFFTETNTFNVKEGFLNIDSARDLDAAVRGYGSKRTIIQTVIEKQIVTEIRTIRETLGRAEALVRRGREALERGKRFRIEDCEDELALLALDLPEYRAAEYELLLATTRRIVEDERNLALGSDLCVILAHLLSIERANEGQPLARLDEMTVDHAGLLACIYNHRGDVCLEDPAISTARVVADRLRNDYRSWDRVAFLHNFIAVGLHNAFRFSDADSLLAPWADFFTRHNEGPGGRFQARAFWIGALLGTFAQGKAFLAHEAYLADNHARIVDLSDEAVYFSLAAQEHFDKEEDKQRQHTYRAHMYLQRAVLANDTNAVEEARSELSDPQPSEIATRFVTSLRERRPDPPTEFRLAVWLKLLWVAGEHPPWLLELASLVKGQRERAGFAARHPHQQILGYLALLAPRDRRCFQSRLSELPFSSLVSFLALAFLAQLELEQDGIVQTVTRNRLTALGETYLRPSWLARRFSTEVERLTHDAKASKGVLALLPFNHS